MPKIHDAGYKKLFSDKRIFQQLLKSFVDEDWVKEIDFTESEIINKSYISDHYKETESDLIYKVKLRDRDAYVMILLEFQSRVDYFMSLRILNYVTNFYMDYVQNNTKLRKLPALFPIMLYNGNSKWRAPTKITELIENGQLPGKHQIRFEYFKIAENEYSKQKLLKMRNLVSTLFLAETHYDIELLKDEFVKLFEREEDKSSISLILNWFLQLKRFGRIEEKDYKAFERVYKEKEEVHEMLITALKKEKEEYFRQGKAEGKEEEKALRNQEIAKVLLRLGHDVKTIQQMTKLLVQEIEALKKMLEE